MSKSPKRPASRRKPAKPMTIELSAEQAEDTKASDAKPTAQRQSTPRVGRDAGRRTNVGAEEKIVTTEKEKQQDKKTSGDEKTDTKADAKTSAKTGKDVKPETAGTGRIAAGFIGGLIALGGGAALQYTGYLPSFEQANTATYATMDEVQQSNTSLSDQIAVLQQKLDSVAAAPAQPDRAELAAIIDARIAAGSNSVDPEVASKLLDVENRTISLEASMSETQTKLDDVAGIVNEFGNNDTADQALSNKLDIVAGDVARIKQQIADEVAKEGVNPATFAALGASVAAIQNQIGSIAAKTDALPESVASAQGVTEQINAARAELSDQVSGIQSTVGDLASGFENQKATVSELQQKVDNGADKRAAQALIAAQLKAQADRGEPFAETLATLQSAGAEGVDYAALKPIAQNGVPTFEQLAQQFGPVSEAITNAVRPASTMSLTDKMLAGARSLVKVKPIGGVEGDGVNAIISRIDSAVSDGDGARASENWLALPEAGKAASQTWHDALQARIAVDGLITNTVQQLISSTISN